MVVELVPIPNTDLAYLACDPEHYVPDGSGLPAYVTRARIGPGSLPFPRMSSASPTTGSSLRKALRPALSVHRPYPEPSLRTRRAASTGGVAYI